MTMDASFFRRDLRARLELAVDHMLEACSKAECVTSATTEEETDKEEEANDGVELEYLMCSPAVTHVARRELAPALRDLMQHGLHEGGGHSSALSLMPFAGCMSGRRARSSPSSPDGGPESSAGMRHAWDVVLAYYRLRKGAEFNLQPQRRLSDSFGLDLAGGSNGNRSSLLAAIGRILRTHGPYKRSADAHFKAFVCEGLKYA